MSRKLIMLEHLPGNRLPTVHQVLQRFEHMRHSNLTNESVSSSIDTIIKEISTIWNKAYIPIQEDKHIKRKLNKMIDRYNAKKKNAKNDSFDLTCFDVLFDIKKLSCKFRNEDDEAFYLDQKGNRIATIGTVDLADNKKIMANQLRKLREEYEEPQKTQNGLCGKRKLLLDPATPPKHEKRQRSIGSYADLDISTCDSLDWEESISPRGKNLRRQRNFNRVNVSIDKQAFLNNIALASDKTFTPSRTAVQIAGAALSTAMDSGESEITRLSLSHSSLHRRRDKLRLSSDKIITENWKKNNGNSLFLLHWDEKSLSHLRQVDGSDSYMAVVLTNLSNGEEKILSIIEMQNSKASEGVAAVIKALQHWSIDKKMIIGCVFDTTNTNSGWNPGVVVRLEEYLEHRILHVYCRHHVFERLANDVVTVCVGSSTSPEELTYKFLIDNWKRLNTANRDKLKVNRRTMHVLQDVIQFATEMKEMKFKDDYQELISLTLILLGAYPDSSSYSVRPPGSISHSRWMAKILCEFKIVIFSSQLLKLELITEADAFSHIQLTLFLILYYVKPWMTATLARDAPLNDVILVNSLKEIPSHLLSAYPLFKSMGEAMNSKLEQHLWYLSEEFVVFSLFSDKMNLAQKNKCRKVMLSHYTENLGHVKGKLMTPMINKMKSIEISILFGKESWRFLRLCGIEGKSFLVKTASSWDNCSEYIMLKDIVSNFVVVNDAAERAILLAKTLQNKLTKNSDIKQALVNVIPELRKICQSQKKEELFKDINSYLQDCYTQ